MKLVLQIAAGVLLAAIVLFASRWALEERKDWNKPGIMEQMQCDALRQSDDPKIRNSDAFRRCLQESFRD